MFYKPFIGCIFLGASNMRRGMLDDRLAITIFVLPAFLFFASFVIFPLILTGFYSVFTYDGIGKMRFAGIMNYVKMFSEDTYFPRALVNSLILAGASIFIQLPVSFILALVLAGGVKGEKAFRTIYFIPVVISSMVIGQLWMKIFKSDYGMLNILIRFFVKDFEFAWLSEPKTAFFATVIPAIWQYIGYHMLIFYAGIKSLSLDYFEAAAIEGATKRNVTFKIIIPLLASVIRTCVVFALTGALRSFDLIYVMTGGGPNHASEVPATLMYTNLFRKLIYGYGSSQAFFIVIECFCLSYIVARVFKKSEENIGLM